MRAEKPPYFHKQGGIQIIIAGNSNDKRYKDSINNLIKTGWRKK